MMRPRLFWSAPTPPMAPLKIVPMSWSTVRFEMVEDPPTMALLLTVPRARTMIEAELPPPPLRVTIGAKPGR